MRIMEIPDKYQGKMFLLPTEVFEILRIQKNCGYDYLHNCKNFKIEPVGSKMLINANSFWDWYYGKKEEVA